MRLPPELEKEFRTYISKPIKSTNMPYITQVSLDLADHIAKEAIGKTYSELTTDVKEKDATIVNAIVHLYSKMLMSIDEIAEVTKLESTFIYDTLKKRKLIRK